MSRRRTTLNHWTAPRSRWKPRGNGGVPNIEIVFSALLLVDAVPLLEESALCLWTQEQLDIAYDWAMRCHFRASDNYVRVPPRPDFIPRREDAANG